MKKEVVHRSSNMFTRLDIVTLCERLRLNKEADAMIEVMRTECYLLLKGPKLYQLLTE